MGARQKDGTLRVLRATIPQHDATTLPLIVTTPVYLLFTQLLCALCVAHVSLRPSDDFTVQGWKSADHGFWMGFFFSLSQGAYNEKYIMCYTAQPHVRCTWGPVWYHCSIVIWHFQSWIPGKRWQQPSHSLTSVSSFPTLSQEYC